MLSFILSTDSCADILKTELQKDNVRYIPLAYIHNGEEHRDHYDSDREYREFYEFIRKGNLPSTTQLNVTEMEDYLESLVEKGEGDVVHITLSSGLSGTYNNAVAAAKTIMERHPDRKVYVVDSLGATQVQAYLVDRGVEDRTKGLTALETYEDLVKLSTRLNVMFVPRDLFHLHRGGRVNKATAIVGTVLQIKPVLEISRDGRLVVVGRVNGWTKGLRTMAKFVLKNSAAIGADTVYIAHADAYEDAVELQALLREASDIKVKIGWIGPVIGTHTGPGAVGVICIGRERTIV